MQQVAYPYFSIAAEALREAGYRYDLESGIWHDAQGGSARIERRSRVEAGWRRRLEYVIVLEPPSALAVCQ